MSWQTVFEISGSEILERFRVSGGWLYRSTQRRVGSEGNDTESMCFVKELPSEAD